MERVSQADAYSRALNEDMAMVTSTLEAMRKTWAEWRKFPTLVMLASTYVNDVTSRRIAWDAHQVD